MVPLFHLQMFYFLVMHFKCFTFIAVVLCLFLFPRHFSIIVDLSCLCFNDAWFLFFTFKCFISGLSKKKKKKFNFWVIHFKCFTFIAVVLRLFFFFFFHDISQSLLIYHVLALIMLLNNAIYVNLAWNYLTETLNLPIFI